MSRFVLTAQLQLQAPANTRQVVAQMQRQLQGGVNLNVNLQNAGRSQRQLQQLNQQVNNLNTARYGIDGIGIYTAALGVGGAGSLPGAEDWNGVSWAAVAALSTGTRNCGTGGTTTAGIKFAGESPPGETTATEEWNLPSVSTRTIDTD